eukprot:scaffold1828_cov169-Amphora_coffeaeformis.AAC.24
MRAAAFSVLASRRTLCRTTRTSFLASRALSGQRVSAAIGAAGGERLWQEQQHSFNSQRKFSSDDQKPYKAWIDKNRSLPSRVKALMDTPKIHPAEISTRRSDLENLLAACCKLQSLEGMQLAQEIMERVLVEKGRYLDENIEVFIPVTMWEVVLFGWAKLARKQAIALERMRDLMDIIVEEGKVDQNHLKKTGMPDGIEIPPSVPTAAIFNTFLHGLTQAAFLSQGAAMIAESTIFEMKGLHTKKGWHTKPNARSYTYVITAHANSWHPKSGENAANILRHVRAEHKIEAAAFKRKRGVEYDVAMVNTTTPRIVTVDATMYTVAMNAALQSRSPPHLVLEMFEDAGKDGVVDRILYNLAIKALAHKVEKAKNPLERLRIAEQAERYLIKADECPESKEVSPKSTLNACLDVWHRTFVAEMGPRSEKLLNKMLEQGLTPDCMSFHAVLRAWSKSVKFHGKDAVTRVEATLRFQQALAEKSNGTVPYPDYQTYSLAILAQVGQGKDSVAKASELLDEMLVAIRERRFTIAFNPCAPFTALLSAVEAAPKEGSSSPDSSLGWSENKHTEPYELANLVYESVIRNAYEVDNLVADHHFYGAMLRNILAHGNPKSVDYENTALRVWEHACEAGQVSRLVWPLAARIPVLHKTFPDPQVRKTIDLPRFWSREVEPRWR